MIRIGLLGYSGRMGQAIAQEIARSDACILASAAVRNMETDYKKAQDFVITSDANEAVAICDVVIDFTLPAATVTHIGLAVTHTKPFVCGTTGLSAETLEILKQAAKKVPVLYAPQYQPVAGRDETYNNFGGQTSCCFDYDVAILDEHHRMKKDAPSGTAKALGEAVTLGNSGKKSPSFAAIRAGHIIGNHEVIFTGNGETIRLHHSVTNRAVFADGAVQAAVWLHNKPAGFYSMDNVLGI